MDPVIAAKMVCDQHICKMPLETAQILCSAFPSNTAPYKRTHFNHPCNKWSRKTILNYKWLILHGIALCKEYTFRYSKTHKSLNVILWCYSNIHELNLPNNVLTPHAQAMPEIYKNPDTVTAYRNFYKYEKVFAKYSKRKRPYWL